MQSHKGFTLIELTVVIVLLSVLAATALPRYVSLRGEARASTLAGFKAALQDANQMIQARFKLNGLDPTAGVMARGALSLPQGTVDGTPVTELGFIKADWDALSEALDLSDGDWDYDYHSTGSWGDPTVNVYARGGKDANCKLVYTAPLNGEPSYQLKTTGCY